MFSFIKRLFKPKRASSSTAYLKFVPPWSEQLDGPIYKRCHCGDIASVCLDCYCVTEQEVENLKKFKRPCECGNMSSLHEAESPGCEYHDHHCDNCHPGSCTKVECRPSDMLWLAILEGSPELTDKTPDQVRAFLREGNFPERIIKAYEKRVSKPSARGQEMLDKVNDAVSKAVNLHCTCVYTDLWSPDCPMHRCTEGSCAAYLPEPFHHYTHNHEFKKEVVPASEETRDLTTLNPAEYNAAFLAEMDKQERNKK